MEYDLDKIFDCDIRYSYSMIVHYDDLYAEVDLDINPISKRYIGLFDNFVLQVSRKTGYDVESHFIMNYSESCFPTLSVQVRDMSNRIDQKLLSDVIEEQWHHVNAFNIHDITGKTFEEAIECSDDWQIEMININPEIIDRFISMFECCTYRNINRRILRKMKKHWDYYY